MTCICGGRFIPGNFFPGHQTDAEFAAALQEFLQRAGPSTQETLEAWVTLRERLALDLTIAGMYERGELEVCGLAENGQPLLQRKPTPEG